MKRTKYNLEDKKRIIIDYIKKNHKATYKDIRKNTKLHPERIFCSLKEAFKEANIKIPRTFDKKTKKEKREIIAKYIKKHPGVGGQMIKKDTKINVTNVFNSIEDAYNLAGLKYPRKIDKRTKNEKRIDIIKFVKQNPLASISEITLMTKTQPYNFFKNMGEIYNTADIKPIKKEEKWKLKKRLDVIEFIKKNPLATQREINKNCKTHVQDLFNKGIFEAYEKANIKFPFERLKLYGIGIKKIRRRAKSFEDEIAIKLTGYGKVNRLVKTKRGFADIILERKNKKIVIEIKDYQNKDISYSQVKQLMHYLEDCSCRLGFLICRSKPKKDKFLIDKIKIYVLDESELNKIPIIIDGLVAK